LLNENTKTNETITRNLLSITENLQVKSASDKKTEIVDGPKDNVVTPSSRAYNDSTKRHVQLPVTNRYEPLQSFEQRSRSSRIDEEDGLKSLYFDVWLLFLKDLHKLRHLPRNYPSHLSLSDLVRKTRH